MQFHCDVERLNPECRYIAIYSYVRNVKQSNLWIHHMLLTAEIIFLVILLVVTNLFLRIMWNSSKFHPNTMRLIMSFVAHANVHCFARFIIMLFQVKLLEFADPETISHKFLLLASELRLYTLYLFLNLFIASMIQRVFAVIFISDYETNQRHYIGKSLVIITIIFSHCKAIDSTFGFVFPSLLWENPRIWSSLIPGIVSELCSKCIFIKNLRLLGYIERSPCDRYTLSTKFQLVENIRTAKLLLKWGFVSVSALIPSCLLLLKHNHCPANSSEESLWGSLFDLFNALAILISILFLVCNQSTWRVAFCSSFRLGRILCTTNAPVATTSDHDRNTDIYFAQFGKAWNSNTQTRGESFPHHFSHMPDKQFD